jgi:hypothetical protein
MSTSMESDTRDLTPPDGHADQLRPTPLTVNAGYGGRRQNCTTRLLTPRTANRLP